MKDVHICTSIQVLDNDILNWVCIANTSLIVYLVTRASVCAFILTHLEGLPIPLFCCSFWFRDAIAVAMDTTI